MNFKGRCSRNDGHCEALCDIGKETMNEAMEMLREHVNKCKFRINGLTCHTRIINDRKTNSETTREGKESINKSSEGGTEGGGV